MYNRYIPCDNGAYQRIPMQEDTYRAAPVSNENEGKNGLFSSLLSKLKLDQIDSGDLLLLAILFLLFKDGDDEELLIALGLLLIL